MRGHSGARQWRHECECAPEVAAERHSQPWIRMHSQVSVANAEYFISEDRLRRDDLDVDDLEAMVERSDGSIICCNVCGRLKEVEASTSDGDGPTTIDDVVGGGRHD